MLFDLLGQQGDNVPYSRYKDKIQKEEDQQKYFDLHSIPTTETQSIINTEDKTRKDMILEMKSNAYLNEDRKSVQYIEDEDA